MTDRPPDDDAATDDDLARAFGPDTASVRTATPRQRIRRGTVIGIGVLLTAAVLAAALWTIIGRVQDGVGGVFPRPEAALARFSTAAAAIDGVQQVRDGTTEKRAFAAYDVTATVVLDDDTAPIDQTAVVRAVSAAADDAGGNGVRVGAVVVAGNLSIGVTADTVLSTQRLDVARTVAAIGGVAAVRCSVGAERTAEDPTLQRIEVVTGGTGAALDTIVATASERAHGVFPGATVASSPN